MALNTKKLVADFYATQRHMAQMRLHANAWHALNINPENLSGPQTFLYLKDHVTGWTWCCSTPKQHLAELACNRDIFAQDVPEILSELAVAAIAAHQASIQRPAKEEVDDGVHIASLGWAYACTTQTFSLAGNLADGGHFFIAMYGSDTRADRSMRPFCSPAHPEAILPANLVLTMFDQVKAKDWVSHPEWFR